MVMNFEGAEFAKTASHMLGRAVLRIEYPGGKTRDTVRLILDDGSAAIATSRKDAVRSTRELQLLYALNAAGVPAPKVLGVDEGFFLQSSVGGQRLSELLAGSNDTAQKEAWLDAALTGLADAQKALAGTDVGTRLENVGASDQACLYRASAPQRLAQTLGLMLPSYDVDAFTKSLVSQDAAPIKLDARPANALHAPDDRLIWIDWDRAGRRNRADDLVCLLFDEYTGIPLASLDTLITRHAHAFKGARDPSEAVEYVYNSGLAQGCYRLELIFARLSKDRRWGDPETCLRQDRVGSAPQHIRRLSEVCLHAIGTQPNLGGLKDLFQRLGDMTVNDKDGLLAKLTGQDTAC